MLMDKVHEAPRYQDSDDPSDLVSFRANTTQKNASARPTVLMDS